MLLTVAGFGYVVFMTTSAKAFIFLQQVSPDSLAAKAEGFYPSDLDSSLIVANQALSQLETEKMESEIEERMLTLKGKIFYRKREYEEAITYLQQALEISLERDNLKQQGEIYNVFGVVYWRMRDYETTQVYYDKSLEIRQKLGDLSGVASSFYNKGLLYSRMGEIDKAHENYLKSIEYREDIGDLNQLENAYLNYGNLLATEGEFDLALQYFQKNLKIQEQQVDTLGLIAIFKNIGLLYYQFQDYERSLTYFTQNEQLIEDAGLSGSVEDASNYWNLGAVYERMNYPQRAISSYRSAITAYEKEDDSNALGNLHQNIGKVFENLEEPDSALFYYDTAQTLFEQVGNEESLANLRINVAVIYNTLNDPEKALNLLLQSQEFYEARESVAMLPVLYNNLGATQLLLRNYDQSIIDYKKAAEASENANNLTRKMHAMMGLSEAYEKKGDFRNAYNYHREYVVLNDSLYNIERTKAVEELITKYETEKKEAEIELLTAKQAQSDAEKKALVLGLLALIFSVVGIIGWFIYSNRKKRIIAEQKETLFQNEIDSLLDRQQLESVSAMLEGQDKERKRLAAELHDRLGSILSLVKLYFSSMDEDIKEKQPDLYASFSEGNQFLDDAFSEVRALIKEMKEGTTSGEGLQKDLEKLLLKITKLGVEIKSRIELDKKLDSMVEINVYRVVQEALSNSLKYSKAELIELILSDKEGLSVTIRDNGIGFDPDKLPGKQKERESYGVENMENRVKLLGGEFVMEAQKHKGVTINVNIPIEEKDEVWGIPIKK